MIVPWWYNWMIADTTILIVRELVVSSKVSKAFLYLCLINHYDLQVLVYLTLPCPAKPDLVEVLALHFLKGAL